MGGSSFDHNCDSLSPKTLVLVGKTGNGKSATANSILGMKIFKSKRSSSGVTITSELHETELEDGQMLNVIDTPGLFDSSLDFKFIGKEIVNCISMAKDGVHAFLVVVSICSRFSEEEKAAISSLLTLFGQKIYDYMIVVFTSGDELEEDGQTLEDFLCNSPEALKETLCLCENRFVLFDNKTKDDIQRSNQVNELLSLVNAVSRKNDGKPYTNEFFAEFKNQRKETEEQEISIDDEKFKRVFEMVESKLKETTLKLEQQLAEERAAWAKAEKEAKAVEKKSNEEKRMMMEQLRKAKMREEERRREASHWRQREWAAWAKAEKEANAAQRKSDEEKRKMKEQLEEAKKREEEQQKEADNWRQREWATWAKAENEANAIRKKLDEEKRKMIEQLEEAKKREEEQQKEANHWRQRERAAWVKAENEANAVQMKSDVEIRKMKEQLEEAKKREEEQQKEADHWRQREWATWAKAENEAKAVQMKAHEEIRKMKEQHEEAKKREEEIRKMKERLEEAKKREEEHQKEADHWRQREEKLRKEAGCVIM